MKLKLQICLIIHIIYYAYCLNTSSVSESSSLIIQSIKKFSRNALDFPNFKKFYDKFFYEKTDIIKVAVKNLYSYKNQIPYDYNYLDLCTFKNNSGPKEGITELLTGQKTFYSNYYVFMNQNETCAWACTKNITDKDIKNYKWLINRQYHTTYYLDKLPSGFLTY